IDLRFVRREVLLELLDVRLRRILLRRGRSGEEQYVLVLLVEKHLVLSSSREDGIAQRGLMKRLHGCASEFPRRVTDLRLGGLPVLRKRCAGYAGSGGGFLLRARED